ncbi:hypothetical protein BY996DRAFT_4639335 [Phakopsora pachyrhizi]|nr:hypothetical protein BY996DRAFT_4639335 [Phakopsora pachyrhizi]
MGFGQVVIGPPGSGKSTYCFGVQQFFKAISRQVVMINLDPAVQDLSYEVDVDIRELVELEEVMQHNRLGPNGSVLFCLEYLEENFDWLVEKIQSACFRSGAEDGTRIEVDYIVMDLPGQVELSTDHQSLQKVLHRLEKLDWRLGVVQLTDSTHIIDPAKYIAIVLLNLKAMLNLGMPHINVLTKIDLLKNLGDQLKLNLDFYTEVQDLSYLLPILDDHTTPKFGKLNRVIIEMIEDFNLVGFETLCVEDKASMTKLILAIDRAIGYYPSNKPKSNASTGEDLSKDDLESDKIRIEDLPMETILEVQERWIDYPELYQQHQNECWDNEAQIVFDRETERSRLDAIQKNRSDRSPQD